MSVVHNVENKIYHFNIFKNPIKLYLFDIYTYNIQRSKSKLVLLQRIEQTEKELRGLQQTCRDLVLKTAVCAEATAQGRSVPNVNAAVATQPTSQRNHSSTR